MSAIPTIAEAAALIAARKLSPVELTKACLERVRALDGRLQTFLLLTEERALADACAAEARLMQGESKGPLDGIPIGHKDIYNTAGIRTTGHSRLLEHNVPAEDATSVRKLAEAGTVLMGKLATHEFAMGGPSFDLPWPPPRNPWNLEHFTGGSSSGTGAAVPAGLVLGGTGSDTGGSIRGPSTLCGLSGIKPTYGLVSRAGVLPLSFTLDHAGPMAWTAEDVALLLQAMAGHDPTDPASADRPVADFSAEIGQDVKGLRIGVIRHFHETDNPASAPTCQAIDAALGVLRDMGAELREVTLSPLQDYAACGWVILLAEAFSVHEPWLKSDYNRYGALLRERLALGGLLRGTDYVQAIRKRRILCAEMAAAMEDLDILVTAVQPAEAARITEVPRWALFEKPSYTIPFNVTGLPAISVCTGFGPGGLPLGMQMVGKPFAEPTLFRAAHAYEKATPWRDRRPSPQPALLAAQ
ncbi:amidase [Roseomonas sp. E05]|uniref:amidase n=1 Tax=Roseomonas sp. E05 TaxID=3046310 RepID=UPI0024BA99C2|nr:amidase [Roseomonas sp. E05]MDJ0390470.1 amidase [Roseomonas sp. E05]